MEKCPYAYYDGNGRWLCVGQGKSFAVSRKGLPGKGCDEKHAQQCAQLVSRQSLASIQAANTEGLNKKRTRDEERAEES